MARESGIKKLALTNGNILTIDDEDTVASAILIAGDRIFSVGSDDEILRQATDGVEVIDLDGKTVVPGFVDCHAHPMGFGESLLAVNCRTPPMRSIGNIVEGVRRAAEEKSEGEWIFGRGYDDFKLEEKRNPNRWDLDMAAPNNPVLIMRLCGHVIVANSLALKLAGISKDTKDPEGGEIDRDPETGEPTGVLRGGAMVPLGEIIPPTSFENLKRGIKLSSDEFLARGVTSVSDAGVGSPLNVKAYMAAKEEGMPLRVNMMMSRGLLEHLKNLGLETGFGGEGLRIGAIKMVFDGSFSGRTAAMTKPFVDTPENSGILYMTQEELDEGVRVSHEAGFHVGVHAIGDRAISGVLDAYEKTLAEKPNHDHRFRIEHCGINSPEIVARIKKMGVIPVPQPIFLYGEGESYRAGLEPGNLKWAYPFKAWLDAGITVAMSSDCPATSGEELISPLLGIYVAVNRKTDAGQELGPEQRVTVEEALRAYTMGGAYATFEEEDKGSIEPGKLADLAVLSRDPTQVDTEEIKDIEVEMTIVGGRVEYMKPS